VATLAPVSLAPRTLVAVALGGGVGSLLRWSVELVLPASPGAVPWATLLVNLLGSAALGAAVVLLDRGALWPGRRAFLTTGLLGGFTTFSTYAVQVALLGAATPVLAVAYAVGTPLLCVWSAWLAGAGARRLGRRP
jgi:fluoride exporter